MANGNAPASRQRGFTYLGVLFLVAIMGAGLATAGVIWHAAQQRRNEEELLFVGNQFRQAIRQYYDNAPDKIKKYPRNLKDMLQDPRYVSTQRYLRKIFTDPMSGDTEWGLVDAPDGGVMGVFSPSNAIALKTSNFSAQDQAFGGTSLVSEWRFTYEDVVVPVPVPVPVAPPGGVPVGIAPQKEMAPLPAGAPQTAPPSPAIQ